MGFQARLGHPSFVLSERDFCTSIGSVTEGKESVVSEIFASTYNKGVRGRRKREAVTGRWFLNCLQVLVSSFEFDSIMFSECELLGFETV